MGRAPCCDKANVKKGPWSPEEDAMLQSYIHKHGTGGNWIALPHKIGLKRCGKSCRLRWLNYLRPNIKHGGFSEEEDRIICNLFVSIGSRWSIIAAQLPGRTDNDIKNYWNTRLKKRLLGRRRDNDSCCKSNLHQTSAQTLTSSAIERLQLHMRLQGLHDPFSFYPSTATQSSTSVSPMKHSPETNTSSSSSSTHHAGLHDLVYGKENHFFADMDCFKEMNDFEEGINWWTDYSMLQEFEI